MACAVRAMAGMCFVVGDALSLRVASQPSTSGRLMSMRMRSGRSLSAIFSPIAPSNAMATVKPFRSRRRESMSRFISLSSTSNIFGMQRSSYTICLLAQSRAPSSVSSRPPGPALEMVGNTPLVRLDLRMVQNVDVYAKLELDNPMGSVKDRAAAYALERGLASGEIARDAWIVESSSGNFGVSLAAYCKLHGLRFHCVIDPRINPTNESMIRMLGARVEKVHDRDEAGGYLLTRLAAVK